MFTSRPQFSLKTALIAVAVLSVVCGMVKFEQDAQRNFSTAVAAVEDALQRAEAGANEELYQLWLRDVTSNPTYAANEWSSHMVETGSRYTSSTDMNYFGSLQDWSFVQTLPSPTSDFSSLPSKGPDDKHIDMHVVCSRPWSVLSRQTSIHVIEHRAPDNSLLTDRLKAELEKAGMQVEVVKEFK